MTEVVGAAPVAWGDRLDDLCRRYGIVGAQFGLVHLDASGRPRERVTVAAGRADAERGVAVGDDTLFEIGSITKMFTAVLVLQLVAEGRLSLDAPIRDVVPGFALRDPDAAARVTMRTLLAHTSGIEGDLFVDTGGGDDSIARYVAALRSARRLHPVGAGFSYCNAGYVVAGRVVEVLRGTRWSDAVAERIIAPLGLAHTHADLRRDPHDDAVRAVGHVAGPDGPRVAPGRIPAALAPAGLIAANAGDLLAFAEMLLSSDNDTDTDTDPAGSTARAGRGILDAASVAAMHRAQVDLHDVHVTAAGWGLGALIEDWGASCAWGHDGATIGQRAYLRVLPEQRTAMVLLTTGGRADGLFRALFAEVIAEVAADVTAASGLAMPPALQATGRLPAVTQATYGFADAGMITENTPDGARLTVIDPSPTGGEPERSTIDLYSSTVPGVWAWTTPDLDGWAPLRPVAGGAYLGLRFVPAARSASTRSPSTRSR